MENKYLKELEDNGIVYKLKDEESRNMIGDTKVLNTKNKDNLVSAVNETLNKTDNIVYVGEGTPPEGTTIHINTGVTPIVIPEVLQTTGDSVEDTISQDTITKELNKKQDKGDYALKSEIPTNASDLNATIPPELPSETNEDIQSVLNALASKPSGVQSDWNQNDETALDYIKNKPTTSTDDNIIDLLMEMGVIAPYINSNGVIYTSSTGELFII